MPKKTKHWVRNPFVHALTPHSASSVLYISGRGRDPVFLTCAHMNLTDRWRQSSYFMRFVFREDSGPSSQCSCICLSDILKSSNLERYLYHASGNTGNLVDQLYRELDTHRKFTVPKQVQCFSVGGENHC